MEKRVIFGICLGILIFLSGVSAEVIIGQTDSLYSFGDSLNVNVTLSSSVGTSDFLVSKLACGSGDIEIYRSPYNLKPGERKVIPISFKLDSLLLRNLGGACNIEASYGQSSSTSQNFDINNRLNVQFYADSVVEPGSEMNVHGSAKKSNGDLLNGFVEISVPELSLSNKGLVNDGQFNSTLYIPKKSPSGSYEINVRVYDKDDLNVVANEGNDSGIIRVKQNIESIDLAFEKLETAPGKDFTYSVLLYDQAGTEARQEVDVSLVNPNGEAVKDVIISSSSSNNFSLKTSDVSGNWKITAKFKGLATEKNFYVSELEDASYYIANNTLYVTNTGNVPFADSIKLSIGNANVTKDVSLEVGEIKKFKLSAPQGSYAISVFDNNTEQYLGRALLSGNSVGVGDYGEISRSISFWVWLIVLIVLCLIVIYFYKKGTNKRYYGKEPSKGFVSPKSLGGFGASSFKPAKSRKTTDYMVIPETKRVSLRPAGPAVKENFGKKDKAVVVALNVRNLDEIASAGDDALAPIGRIIDNARKNGAKFKDENNYKLFIFAPSMSKDKNSTYNAIQFVKKVETFLSEYNKKKALKIDFGVGGNAGELIIEAKQGQFKINSSGNTILLAKKAAARAKNEAIITSALKHELPNIIKATAMPGENFFKLNNIVDRSPQEEFISKFMNRQQKK